MQRVRGCPALTGLRCAPCAAGSARLGPAPGKGPGTPGRREGGGAGKLRRGPAAPGLVRAHTGRQRAEPRAARPDTPGQWDGMDGVGMGWNWDGIGMELGWGWDRSSPRTGSWAPRLQRTKGKPGVRGERRACPGAQRPHLALPRLTPLCRPKVDYKKGFSHFFLSLLLAGMEAAPNSPGREP